MTDTTPTREQREAAELAVDAGVLGYLSTVTVGMLAQLNDSVAQALAAERARGRAEERAAVIAYIKANQAGRPWEFMRTFQNGEHIEETT